MQKIMKKWCLPAISTEVRTYRFMHYGIRLKQNFTYQIVLQRNWLYDWKIIIYTMHYSSWKGKLFQNRPTPIDLIIFLM
jgi:hypothetical protein